MTAAAGVSVAALEELLGQLAISTVRLKAAGEKYAGKRLTFSDFLDLFEAGVENTLELSS
jgi:hypothetical protein